MDDELRVIAYKEISSRPSMSATAERILSLYPEFESSVKSIDICSYEHTYYVAASEYKVVKETIKNVIEFKNTHKNSILVSLIMR